MRSRIFHLVGILGVGFYTLTAAHAQDETVPIEEELFTIEEELFKSLEESLPAQDEPSGEQDPLFQSPDETEIAPDEPPVEQDPLFESPEEPEPAPDEPSVEQDPLFDAPDEPEPAPSPEDSIPTETETPEEPGESLFDSEESKDETDEKDELTPDLDDLTPDTDDFSPEPEETEPEKEEIEQEEEEAPDEPEMEPEEEAPPAIQIFNIRGVKPGDTVEQLKEVFPEIEITESLNTADCKYEKLPIDNGSSFEAVKDTDEQDYSFSLILVDGVQTVVKGVYFYTSSTLKSDFFKEKIVEKYDIDAIPDEDLLAIRDAFIDYKGITHFVHPKDHYFKILEDQILRLKYNAEVKDPFKEEEITHTVTIESSKYMSLDHNQSELGQQEKQDMEDACGRDELKELAF